MFNIIKFLEDVLKFMRIKIKICYWKLKYGKRIEIGKNLKFRKGMIINISKKGFLKIGDNNFFNNYCSINCHKKVIIGNNNLFGENVKIYDHNHIFNNKKIDIKTSYKDNDVLIGNRNWIASNVLILSKAKLEDNSIISAGVVVNNSYNSDIIIKRKDTYVTETIQYDEI